MARELQPCGTIGAAERHRRNREPVDDACLAARRAYHLAQDRGRRDAIWRKRQRQEAAETAYRLSPAGKREAALLAAHERGELTLG